MQNKLGLNIETIINEYSNYVFKIINNVSGTSLNYQDKEEIASDTFYLLWKYQDKIQTNLKSYIGTIAKNCTYKKLKEIKKAEQYEDTMNGEFYDFSWNIAIEEKIKSLSTNEAVIFDLYYIKGYKTKEISKMINKSNTNIKVILYRIRKKLKEEF